MTFRLLSLTCRCDSRIMRWGFAISERTPTVFLETAKSDPFDWIAARKVMPEREVTIIRHSLPAYPKFLAGEHRLKNRFYFVASNGDFR